MARGGALEGVVGEVQAGGPAHHHESILGVWPILLLEKPSGVSILRYISISILIRYSNFS